MNGSARARSLRIGIDGRAFTSVAAGVRRYTWELARGLVREAPDAEVVAIGLDDPTAAPPGILARPPGFTLPSNLGWSLIGLPLSARGTTLDVFHAPAYTAPLAGLRPLVLTVHDVSYARAPEDYPYRHDAARQWFYRRSALAADAIITDSSFSQSEIVAAFGVPADRVTVVPLGVAEEFRPAERDASPDALPPGVRLPYVLHVGDVHERRRPALLLDAVLRARNQHPQLRGLQLVFAGRDHDFGDRLRQRAIAEGAADAIRVAGTVSATSLLALFQHASAFVYASRYEGFGLPLLEAMACGTPVVAIRAASVEEVVGGAGLLLDRDAGAGSLAEALGSVLISADRSAELRRAGLARAAYFTWERTARATLSVYRRVIARVRR
jgi:glycosyltransferase involved in cell wall biosynthesis